MLKPSSPIVLATIAAGAGGGAAIDVWTRRVPNWLSLALAAAGLVFAASGISGLSLGGSITGFALGLLLMMPGHLIGATGAGDVKLFAGVGAVVGPAHTVAAFFYTAIAGGVLALLVAARRRRLQETIGGTARLVATSAANAAEIESPRANNRFAYAPAIAAGALLAALGA